MVIALLLPLVFDALLAVADADAFLSVGEVGLDVVWLGTDPPLITACYGASQDQKSCFRLRKEVVLVDEKGKNCSAIQMEDCCCLRDSWPCTCAEDLRDPSWERGDDPEWEAVPTSWGWRKRSTLLPLSNVRLFQSVTQRG